MTVPAFPKVICQQCSATISSACKKCPWCKARRQKEHLMNMIEPIDLADVYPDDWQEQGWCCRECAIVAWYSMSPELRRELHPARLAPTDD